MVFYFNNYQVGLNRSENDGKYTITITKITGPASFDRQTIMKTEINSIESLNSCLSKYIPENQLSVTG